MRALPDEAYGFGPIIDDANGGLGAAHTDDERLAQASFEKLVEFLWYAVVDVAASHN